MCYVNKETGFFRLASCLKGWVSATKFGAIMFPETCIYCIDKFCLFISIIFFSFEPYNEFCRVTVQKMGRLIWNHGAARAAGGDFCLFSNRSDRRWVLRNHGSVSYFFLVPESPELDTALKMWYYQSLRCGLLQPQPPTKTLNNGWPICSGWSLQCCCPWRTAVVRSRLHSAVNGVMDGISSQTSGYSWGLQMIYSQCMWWIYSFLKSHQKCQ